MALALINEFREVAAAEGGEAVHHLIPGDDGFAATVVKAASGLDKKHRASRSRKPDHFIGIDDGIHPFVRNAVRLATLLIIERLGGAV